MNIYYIKNTIHYYFNKSLLITIWKNSITYYVKGTMNYFSKYYC